MIDYPKLQTTALELLDALYEGISITCQLVYPPALDGTEQYDTTRFFVDNDPGKALATGRYFPPGTIPTGDALIIGKVADLPNVTRCNYIILNSPQSGIIINKYIRVGAPHIDTVYYSYFFQSLKRSP